MLGHAQPSMTLQFAHVGDREVEDAAKSVGTVLQAAMIIGLMDNLDTSMCAMLVERSYDLSLTGPGCVDG